MPNIAAGEAVKGELFRLTQATTDIVATTDAVMELTFRYLDTVCWKYQVPPNQELVFLTEHRLSFYLEDDTAVTAVEFKDTQEVRIEVKDTTKRKTQILYDSMYVSCKEATDRDLMAHYQISEPYRARAGDWIEVSVRHPTVNAAAAYTIDVSDCYFTMEMLRIRPTMFPTSA